MIAASVLMIRRRSELWSDERLWICWPMFFVQWFVFLLLPAFTPYLAFSSVLASLIIVLLWQPREQLFSTRNVKWAIAGTGFAICLVFIVFQGGKFVISSDERLTPIGLHAAVAPILEDSDTKFYTASARLIPPLIDYFTGDDGIKVNFTYLSPNCFGADLLERANRHASNVLPETDLQQTYWGVDRTIVANFDYLSDGNELNFYTKGASSIVSLVPSDQIYIDDKNMITRASSVVVTVDDQLCSDFE